MITVKGAVALGVVCGLVGLTVFAFAIYESRSPSIPQLHFWITGYNGGLYYYNGSLERIPVPTYRDLTDIAWRHDRAYAMVVGKNDTILKFDGQKAVVINSTGISARVHFYGVSWKFDDSEALIVGSNGTVARFDGTSVTLLNSGSTNTIYAVSWNPVNGVALLAGNATDETGFLLQYDGSKFTPINATRVFPHKDPYILYAIDWNPTGGYALIGGTWATLFRYEGGAVTQINMLQLFGNNVNDAHWIRAVKFNSFDGTALIVGQHGTVILYDRGALTRTRTYSTPTGTEDDLIRNAQATDAECSTKPWYDLHCIGHFWGVEWIPGSKIAYAVGATVPDTRVQSSVIARISDMKVELVSHGQVPALTDTSNN
jgi:hypothetical protein